MTLQDFPQPMNPASVDLTILIKDSSVITFHQPFLMEDFILISSAETVSFHMHVKNRWKPGY